MTMLLGGEPTTLTSVPRHWHGPLPSLSPIRQLPTRGGWAPVPAPLLHGGHPDLGVLIWVWLRLEFQDRSGQTNYQTMAAELGLDHLSNRVSANKISLAVQPLLGSWIIRKKLDSNTFTYRAVNIAPNDRYAVIRRGDLGMLTLQGAKKAKVSDIANFGRWQLECGRLGWTAEPTRLIADRWNVTHPTIRQSRDRLAALGLLEVVHRPGPPRLSDLIWLKELYNPHWAVPDAPIEVVDDPSPEAVSGWKDFDDSTAGEADPVGRFSVTGPEETLEDFRGLGRKDSGDSVGRISVTPIRNLTESLSDDLSELGGTSVPTLTSLPREMVDAPPPASSSEEHITGVEPADHRHTAARLIGRHRVLATAKPHFRTAMVKRLTAALEQGLAPGHADRALALVAEEAAFDAECLLLRRALQQAWTDQRVGMCADCGDLDRHSPGCSQFDFSWNVQAAPASDETPSDSRLSSAPADPLMLLLRRPVGDPDAMCDDTEILDWMTVQLARQIVDASDPEARLRTVWTRWRTNLRSSQRELLDRANEHVRYALNLRRVS